MNEHVMDRLEAYHDGELRGLRLHQVENHLGKCETCRAELEALQTLSSYLSQSPALENLTPAERFVARVGLRLGPAPEQPVWRRTLHLGWQLTPFGLLGALVFIQIVFLISGAVMLVMNLGIIGDPIGNLVSTINGDWLVEIFGPSAGVLSDLGQTVLGPFRSGGSLGWSITLNLLLTLAIGLCYWSWLASWWVRRQHQERQAK
ncbi:MAG: hypothetical protein GTO18_22315 [Anaerolineales bacterium]|nr:hypothetical protein [Anaerolineales bacterium]